MKRLFFFFLLLLMAGQAWGATVRVSGAGGTYGAGDNSDGLTWPTAYTTIPTAIAALTGTTDDIIILDPTETFTLAATINTNTSGKTGGSITLKSETEDHTSCIIEGGSGAFGLISHNEIGVDVHCTGIQWANHTRTDGNAVIAISQGALSNWNNCKFSNLKNVRAAGGNHAIFYVFTSSVAVTMDQLTLFSLQYDCTSATKGAFIGSDDGDVSFALSNLDVSGCTIGGIYNFSATAMMGGFYFQGPMTLSGTNRISGVSMTGSSQSVYALFRMSNTANWTGDTSITGCTQITTTGSSEGVAAIVTGGTAYITGKLRVAHNSLATDGNSIGAFVGYGNGASLWMVGPDIEIDNNDIGTNAAGDGTVAASQGADMMLDGVSIHDNIAENGGGVRFGGWGQCKIINSKIYNNSTDAATGKGGGIYSMLHSDTPDAHPLLHEIYNNAIYNNKALNGQGLYIEEADITAPLQTLTVSVYNNILWNVSASGVTEFNTTTAEDEIDGSGTYALNLGNNIIEGGLDAVDGETDAGGNINANPMFADVANGDYRVKRGGPGRGKGAAGLVTTDYRGRAFASSPDIGAYQSKVQPLTRGSRVNFRMRNPEQYLP